MKLATQAITQLANEGRYTLQVPEYWVGSEPHTADFPAKWFIKLRGQRPATGREEGHLFLSRAGYEANKDALKAAISSPKAKLRHGHDPQQAWMRFEAMAEEHFKKVEAAAQKYCDALEAKLEQAKAALMALEHD